MKKLIKRKNIELILNNNPKKLKYLLNYLL